MEQQNNLPPVSKEALWYFNNYILLKDYYNRTISRIAARCIRKGNIAIEEYPFYGYILDVLEEICEVGDYILEHKELYPYVESRMKGGLEAFKRNLQEYRKELEKMKYSLKLVTKNEDQTVGDVMNMDKLMDKLKKQQNNKKSKKQ